MDRTKRLTEIADAYEVLGDALRRELDGVTGDALEDGDDALCIVCTEARRSAKAARWKLGMVIGAFEARRREIEPRDEPSGDGA